MPRKISGKIGPDVAAVKLHVEVVQLSALRNSMNVVSPSIQKIDIGGGRIVSRSHGSAVVFSELSSTYPLKLLSPRITQAGIALVYILSYGGGLVGGDRIKLSVDVGSETTLVLLSQVSRYNPDTHTIAKGPSDRARRRSLKLDPETEPQGVPSAHRAPHWGQ
jgi:hypothetical protein